MASGKLTIAGMYNYNSHLFDEMALPVIPTADMLGLPDDMIIPEAYRQYMAINLADLIGKICLDSAGFSTLYMDADLMQILIGVWSRSRIQTWQRLYNTYFLRYNPLWNKDGHISRTNTGSTTKDNQASARSDTRDNSSGYSRQQGFEFVNGYDQGDVQFTINKKQVDALTLQDPSVHQTDSTFTNEDASQHIRIQEVQDITAPISPKPNTEPEAATVNLTTSDGTQSEMMSANLNNRTNSVASVGKELNAIESAETVHEYGNIGVTTSQQMLEAERALAMNNLYETISREFVKKFCIMVY